ncbi:MAG: hypothetical protein ACMG57_00420 [Candidatus Dojkabacteria bacterium]
MSKSRIALFIGLISLFSLAILPKAFAQDATQEPATITAEQLKFGKCPVIKFNNNATPVTGCTWFNDISTVVFWSMNDTYYAGVADVSLVGNWMDVKTFASSPKPIFVKFVETMTGRGILMSVYQSDKDMYAFALYSPEKTGWAFQQLTYSGYIQQELGENYECLSFQVQDGGQEYTSSCFAPDNNTLIVNFIDDKGIGWAAVLNRSEESLYLLIQSNTTVVSIKPNKSGFMVGNGQFGVQIYAHADGNYSFNEPTEDEMIPTMEGHPV